MIEDNKKQNKAKGLSLKEVPGKEGLFQGVKSNGVIYTVRKDRLRYFFPDEWTKFISCLREDKKILFETLLQTGARIEEALNLKPKDFIWENNSVTLRVTKSKATKGESRILGGKARAFSVSSQYLRRLRKHIREKKIKDNEFIFPITKQAAHKMLKGALGRAELNSWEFSLHNIRKTSGMWLKTVQRRGYDLDVSEICMRLGHDHNTFLKHYGSPSIFTDQQRDKIVDILGDMYKLR